MRAPGRALLVIWGGRRAQAAGELPVRDVIGGAEQGEAAGGFGQAVGLQKRAADDLGGLAQDRERDRGGAVDDVLQRAPVGGLGFGPGQQALQDGGHDGGVRDLAVDQHVQDAQGVRGLLEEQAAAVEVRG